MVERDKPLSFHWRAKERDFLEKVTPPKNFTKRQRRAWESVLLDSVLEGLGEGRWLSYSRRKSFYSGLGRYQGTDYAYSTVPPVVDYLGAIGAIEHEKADPGQLGWQSRFRATSSLLGAVDLPPVTYDPFELIRLKKGKRLLDYRDTDKTETWRRKLQGFNEAISGSVITLDVGERDGNVIRCGSHTLYPAMKCLYRVFNDDWMHGGRFYGGWWQQARKADRVEFRIDGTETVELDYNQLHPRLIYGMAGQELEGDAYTLHGWPRNLGKRAFNILINAKTYSKAVGAVANEIGGSGAWSEASRLIEAMKNRHQSIAGFFHSDAGRKLQKTDSDMAERIMEKMTGRGIVALPIHDSCIVPKLHKNTLEEAMNEALEIALKKAA